MRNLPELMKSAQCVVGKMMKFNLTIHFMKEEKAYGNNRMQKTIQTDLGRGSVSGRIGDVNK